SDTCATHSFAPKALFGSSFSPTRQIELLFLRLSSSEGPRYSTSSIKTSVDRRRTRVKEDDLMAALKSAVKAVGEDAVISTLQKMSEHGDRSQSVLTVIGNAGVHRIPIRYCRGEVYEVSRGTWDVASEDQLNRLFGDFLVGLARKLRERRWNKIYFV